MNELSGGCHCGAIEVRFTTAFVPSTLPVRRCQCSFCRSHGARTATDPAGQLQIRWSQEPIRYRFNTGLAEYLICSICGIYVAAVMEADGASYATVNVNTLEGEFAPGGPMTYSDETKEERRVRRMGRWTPTSVFRNT